MKPIKLNTETHPPTQIEVDEMWINLEYEIVDQNFEFITLLKENIGGILYFKGFKFHENDIFDWYCSRGILSTIEFEKKFLLSDKVLKTFQVIEGSHVELERAYGIGKMPKFDSKSEFPIDEELTKLLLKGGAYGSKFQGNQEEAKNKAHEFCNQLFQKRFTHDFVKFYTSENSWNSWFIDFAIDKTYLIFCMQTRTLWMLAFTDSD